jgi:asparagine synthase (glutamine-hydrolysing)
LEVMDQPATDGVNMYFVAKIAAAAGMKTALSGLGGDELLGGYASFRDIPRMARTFSLARSFPGLGRMCRLVAAPVLKRFTSPKYAGLLEYGGSYAGAYLLRRGLFMPWELPEVMDRIWPGRDGGTAAVGAPGRDYPSPLGGFSDGFGLGNGMVYAESTPARG